jgi:hypothetical protein
MKKIGGIWKTKIFFRILFEGALASWRMQKIGGIWKPQKNFRILFEGGARWLMQKISGIWKPKKNLGFFLRELGGDEENWRDLKTQNFYLLVGQIVGTVYGPYEPHT